MRKDTNRIAARQPVAHQQFVWHATYIHCFPRINRTGLKPSGTWGNYVYAHNYLLDVSMMYPYSIDFIDWLFSGTERPLEWDALLVRIDTNQLGKSWFVDPLWRELVNLARFSHDGILATSWWRSQFIRVQGHVPAEALKFFVYSMGRPPLESDWNGCEGVFHLGSTDPIGEYMGTSRYALSLVEFTKADYVERIRNGSCSI